MRDPSPVSSNWRAQGTLRDYLTRHNIVAIGDIDTRALTKKLRSARRDARHHRHRHASIRRSSSSARAASRTWKAADLVKDVTCAEAYDFETSLADAVTRSQLWRHAAAPRQAPAARRGLRLRHQAEHPAPPRGARLQGARVSRVDAGVGTAGLEAGRHLSEQRPRRSGRRHLRDRQRQGDRRRATCRCSASASATS